MRQLYVSLALMFIVGCKNNVATDKSEVAVFWEDIFMNLGGNQELKIFNWGDSAVFTKWTDSLVETNPKKTWIRIKPLKVVFPITKSEKDSLFKWTRKLVRGPVEPEQRCTDYVGYLSATIEYGNRSSRTKQTCEYSSICDWFNVNDDTKSLYRLLKTRIKDVE